MLSLARLGMLDLDDKRHHLRGISEEQDGKHCINNVVLLAGLWNARWCGCSFVLRNTVTLSWTKLS